MVTEESFAVSIRVASMVIAKSHVVQLVHSREDGLANSPTAHWPAIRLFGWQGVLRWGVSPLRRRLMRSILKKK